MSSSLAPASISASRTSDPGSKLSTVGFEQTICISDVTICVPLFGISQRPKPLGAAIEVVDLGAYGLAFERDIFASCSLAAILALGNSSISSSRALSRRAPAWPEAIGHHLWASVMGTTCGRRIRRIEEPAFLAILGQLGLEAQQDRHRSLIKKRISREGLLYIEIAQRLGRSMGTVFMKVHRLRRAGDLAFPVRRIGTPNPA